MTGVRDDVRGQIYRVDKLPADDIWMWNNLLDLYTSVRSPFLSYGFCLAVQQARGDVFVCVVEQDDETLGYFPFQMKRRPHFIGHAENVGAGLSDWCCLIGDQRCRLPDRRLLKLAGLSAFRFDHLPREAGIFWHDNVQPSTGECVVIDDFQAYRAALRAADKDFINGQYRLERQLAERHGPITFSFHTDSPMAELERLISEKRQQYARTGAADALAERWKRDLLTALHKQQYPGCKPVLSTLFAGPHWVATNLSLAYRDTLHVWFPVYNMEFRRFGPGFAIFLKLFEAGVAQGYRHFDFGEGSAAYKKRLLGTEYTVGKGVVTAGNIAGFSERLLQSLAWRMETRTRRKPLSPAAGTIKKVVSPPPVGKNAGMTPTSPPVRCGDARADAPASPGRAAPGHHAG